MNSLDSVIYVLHYISIFTVWKFPENCTALRRENTKPPSYHSGDLRVIVRITPCRAMTSRSWDDWCPGPVAGTSTSVIPPRHPKPTNVLEWAIEEVRPKAPGDNLIVRSQERRQGCRDVSRRRWTVYHWRKRCHHPHSLCHSPLVLCPSVPLLVLHNPDIHDRGTEPQHPKISQNWNIISALNLLKRDTTLSSKEVSEVFHKGRSWWVGSARWR